MPTDTITADAHVSAECHSDDFVYEADFNAVPWLAQASDDEIRDLAKCEWRGDYAADAVAQFTADHDEEVCAVLDYASRKRNMGFEVSVNEEEARAWLAEHRPALAAELDTAEEF